MACAVCGEGEEVDVLQELNQQLTATWRACTPRHAASRDATHTARWHVSYARRDKHADVECVRKSEVILRKGGGEGREREYVENILSLFHLPSIVV